MRSEPLSIVQVNTYEWRGGAASVAHQLFEAYRAAGHRSTLLVGRGEVSDPDAHRFPVGGWPLAAHLAAGPLRLVDRYRGRETYHYPGTRSMLDGLPEPPDILHLHNLHGGYFDMRQLPALSRRYPVVLTLHDAWLLSGHCAHSFGCERWQTGCGSCPDLDIYPAVRKDATAKNWDRKRDIFRRSRLHVATPSRWLADKVRDSILATAVEELRVIPNGIDLDVFAPGSQTAARTSLGLPAEGHVLLTSGADVRTNPFKDLNTARTAAERAAEILGRDITLLVLGDGGNDERRGRATIRFVPFQQDPRDIARYFQAADVYLHAAHADTFPLSVIEALACGTPVVATAVGGIPEQVGSLGAADGSWVEPKGGNATGILVARGDAQAMGRAASHLLADADVRARLGTNARNAALERFGAERNSQTYLSWYVDLLNQCSGTSRS